MLLLIAYQLDLYLHFDNDDIAVTPTTNRIMATVNDLPPQRLTVTLLAALTRFPDYDRGRRHSPSSWWSVALANTKRSRRFGYEN
jgi:hypothetical protein